MTAGLRRSVDAMLRARRICSGCGEDAGYCISRRLGVCTKCADGVMSR